MNILRMVNPVMPYAWGSQDFIQQLLGDKAKSKQPVAELWMGAHPKCSSQIQNGDLLVDLNYIIAEDPNDFLGCRTALEYNDHLPFLLKVLAAEHPLSIQVHPNQKQAKEGFKRENALGIALDSPLRNYRDAFHKPELLVALTPFTALCGFREPAELVALLSKYKPGYDSTELADFIAHPDILSLRKYFSALLNLGAVRKKTLLKNYIDKISSAKLGDSKEKLLRDWTLIISKLYPGDIGILAPLLMNIIELKPLEGLFLESGMLHSYLQGAGMEIMANSDNVLRGALTPKHVDTDELLKIVDFSQVKPKHLNPVKVSVSEHIYKTLAREFALSVIRHEKAKKTEFKPSNSAEILFCYEGSFTVENCSQILTLNKGQSLFVPFEVEGYALEGTGTVFRAKCNF